MYVAVRHNVYMAVPISQFRKDIFSLAEAALKGTVVEFTHKGVTFKVIPDKPSDKVGNIRRFKSLTLITALNPLR